jgi:hypothetical protein
MLLQVMEIMVLQTLEEEVEDHLEVQQLLEDLEDQEQLLLEHQEVLHFMQVQELIQ